MEITEHADTRALKCQNSKQCHETSDKNCTVRTGLDWTGLNWPGLDCCVVMKLKKLCADKQFCICVTSVFRCEVDDIFAHLEYYAE